MEVTRAYLNTMNSGSIPFWDGSYNFTDITEFKPTQCFHKEGHAEKGQGLTRGHTQEDSGEAQKQRTTSWGKHRAPSHLMHFRLPAWVSVT